MTNLLEVKDLHVSIEGKEILSGLSLTIEPGTIHVILGPNGAGKSTLANAIMAHPKYKITRGDILFEGESILDKSADERARAGIFLCFQNPQEVPGVTVEDFLRTAVYQKSGKNPSILQFNKEIGRKAQALEMGEDLSGRYLNVGFSGGEKKKTEILQMQTLDPKFVMLDETDSGLDVDAVRVVSQGVADFLNEEKSCLIITHISTILQALQPDVVHVIMDGRIVKEGDGSLLARVQEEGYGWIREELGLEAQDQTSAGEEDKEA